MDPMQDYTEGDFDLVQEHPFETVPHLEAFFPFLPYFNHPDPEQAYADAAPPHEHILAQRRRMPDGGLFLDELLALLDIGTPPSLYPCTDVYAFENLLTSILSSQQGTLRSRCVILYLVLAFSSPSASSEFPSSLPSQYASTANLPQGYIKSIHSFYKLDNSHYSSAIADIVDPHLTPDFVPKVFRVLSSLTNEGERSSLVLKFWRLGGVTLEEEEQMGIVLDALCDKRRQMGVWEAWKMARNWAEDEEGRKRLYERILVRCFGGIPDRVGFEATEVPKTTTRPTPISQHLQTLLVNPFTPKEESLSREFCLNPPETLREYASLVADWRLSKYVAESKPVEAIRFGNDLRKRKGGVIKKGADSRKALLEGVKATLTEVQKNLLDLDEDVIEPTSNTNKIATTSSSSLTNNNNSKASLTQPAWKPKPIPPPSPLPTSLLNIPSKSPPKPATPITPTDLPLSASPFLRKEKQLVSSSDARSLGGTQKSVLRAMKDAGAGYGERESSTQATPSIVVERRLPSLFGGDTGTGMSSRYSPGPGSPGLFSTSQDGRLMANQERVPTLSGFGSLRRVTSNGSFSFGGGRKAVEEVEGGDEEEVMATPMAEVNSAPTPTPTTTTKGRGGLASLQQQQKQDFALRATQDPIIAAAISAAAAESPPRPRPHPTSKTLTKSKAAPTGVNPTKRRDFSTRSEAPSPSGEKRRAVSREPEDRPIGAVRINNDQDLPGAFPSEGGGEEGEDEDWEMVQQKNPRVRRPKRATRASSASVEPQQETPVKKRGTRASSVVPAAVEEEGTPGPVRRSRRVASATPVKEKEVKKPGTAKKGKKAIVEE